MTPAVCHLYLCVNKCVCPGGSFSKGKIMGCNRDEAYSHFQSPSLFYPSSLTLYHLFPLQKTLCSTLTDRQNAIQLILCSRQSLSVNPKYSSRMHSSQRQGLKVSEHQNTHYFPTSLHVKAEPKQEYKMF